MLYTTFLVTKTTPGINMPGVVIMKQRGQKTTPPLYFPLHTS